MNGENPWYADPQALLEELRRTGMHWGQLPEIPGYDRMVEIRRGGQGVVYRARQRSTNRTVAVKVILDGLFATEESLLRFQREIESAARLRHPHIVRIYDSGVTVDGMLFYVMEYVDGLPVDHPGLAHAGRLRETLRLFATICDAVQHAHWHGVIHRDLKPGNLLIDGGGSPRILDFGLAKTAMDGEGDEGNITSVSRTGRFLGSLAWASPEQVEGSLERIDSKTDVYSLGVMLYRLITGRLPHIPSGNHRQTLNEIMTADPPRPRALDKSIPDDVETIVLRCLAKEPERRYQAAGDPASDIRRFLAGAPIDAKRDRTWYVLRKTVARHKAAAALILLLLVFVLGFAVTMTLLYRRALNAERLARESLEETGTQTAKAQAVRDFLQDMLATADPFVFSDRSLTVREMLDAAARQIEGRFSGHPEVAAEIHAVIGEACYGLGHLDAAEKHDRKALDLLRGMHGEDGLPVAARLRDLAVVETDRRRFEEAEALLEEALSLILEQGAEEDHRTADCLLSLAELRQAQFRFEEAHTLYERAFGIYRQRFGLDNQRSLLSLVQWAGLLASTGNEERAESSLQQVLEVITKHPGEYEAFRSGTLLSLGIIKSNTGDLDSAESYLQQAMQSEREVFGEEHPRMAEIFDQIGHLHRRKGRHEEAESWYRKALAVCEKIGSRESADGAHCLWNIAQSRWFQNDFEGAEALFKEAIEIRRGIYEPNHHMMQASLSQLGILLREAGLFGKALPYLEEAARLRITALGRDHVLTARANALLGECLAELGRHEDSEHLLLEALRVFESKEEVHPSCVEHVNSSLARLAKYRDSK